MLTYAKYVIAGLFVASLIIVGFKVRGWYDDAALLPGARLELRNQQQRMVENERRWREILVTETARVAKEAKTNSSVKVVQRTIREYVQSNNRNCDLPANVADRLQDLREGRDVPEATP